MRVLFVWAPHVPFYFNPCHHIAQLWEIAAYFQNKADMEIKALDGGALNTSWSQIIKELIHQEYDLLAILNNFDNTDAIERLAKCCRRVSPNTKILTYGEASSWIPGFFKNFNIDAIVYSGDWEAAIEDYAEFVRGKCPFNKLRGLLVNSDGKWQKTGEGRFLHPSEWGFPPLEDMPLDDYCRLYQKEGLKIAGIPGSKELSVTISRGCPMGCRWCHVPKIQGLKDRRREARYILDFIDHATSEYSFDYISMYSPIFTANREYVVDFCNEIKRRSMKFKWKCVTTVFHINEELIRLMAQSGCFRIGFGVETLEKSAQENLNKTVKEERLEKIVSWCLKYSVQPLCFLMIGVPGQTRDGVMYTINQISNMGGTTRITAYTPYQQLHKNMPAKQIMAFDRQTINSDSVKGLSEKEFYQLIFGS